MDLQIFDLVDPTSTTNVLSPTLSNISGKILIVSSTGIDISNKSILERLLSSNLKSMRFNSKDNFKCSSDLSEP